RDRVGCHEIQPSVAVHVDRQDRRERRSAPIEARREEVGGEMLIARVPDPVAVAIVLQRIEAVAAVVHGAAQPVPIRIVQGVVGTRIADVSHAVGIPVLLERIRDPRAVVDRTGRGRCSGIAEAVPVGVRASVAGVSDPVAIGVALARVGGGGTVVHIAADTVPIRIVRRIGRARVAQVPQAVPVPVGLPRIVHVRAIVHVLADTVPVSVVGGVVGTAVAGVSNRVVIGVRLRGVVHGSAVVDRADGQSIVLVEVHEPVPVLVVAGIARVADPVAVIVGLVGVRPGGAVVHRAAHAVAVLIIRRVGRAEVAGVARSIAVDVLLAWIGDSRAVVHRTGIVGEAWIGEAVVVDICAGVGRIRYPVAVRVLSFDL